MIFVTDLNQIYIKQYAQKESLKVNVKTSELPHLNH